RPSLGTRVRKNARLSDGVTHTPSGEAHRDAGQRQTAAITQDAHRSGHRALPQMDRAPEGRYRHAAEAHPSYGRTTSPLPAVHPRPTALRHLARLPLSPERPTQVD